jgi:hypothetical protein
MINDLPLRSRKVHVTVGRRRRRIATVIRRSRPATFAAAFNRASMIKRLSREIVSGGRCRLEPAKPVVTHGRVLKPGADGDGKGRRSVSHSRLSQHRL